MGTDEYEVIFAYDEVSVVTLAYLDQWGDDDPETIKQLAIGQAEDRLIMTGIDPQKAIDVSVEKTGEYR